MFYTWLDSELLALSGKKIYQSMKMYYRLSRGLLDLKKGVRGTPNPKAPRVNNKKKF